MIDILLDIWTLICTIVCFAGFLTVVIELSDIVGGWINRKIATNRMRRTDNDNTLG